MTAREKQIARLLSGTEGIYSYREIARIFKTTEAKVRAVAHKMISDGLAAAPACVAGNWADSKTATPLQDVLAVKQMGQRRDIAAAHRRKNRPSDN